MTLIGLAASQLMSGSAAMLQVAIQVYIDGSIQISFRNLTILGASSKAHYDAYGPSASVVMVDSFVRCHTTVATVPLVTYPATSILGVPANATEVSIVFWACNILQDVWIIMLHGDAHAQTDNTSFGVSQASSWLWA